MHTRSSCSIMQPMYCPMHAHTAGIAHLLHGPGAIGKGWRVEGAGRWPPGLHLLRHGLQGARQANHPQLKGHHHCSMWQGWRQWGHSECPARHPKGRMQHPPACSSASSTLGVLLMRMPHPHIQACTCSTTCLPVPHLPVATTSMRAVLLGSAPRTASTPAAGQREGAAAVKGPTRNGTRTALQG